jgi:hypothetical protein
MPSKQAVPVEVDMDIEASTDEVLAVRAASDLARELKTGGYAGP